MTEIPKPIYPPKILTVIIRNDAPLIHLNDPPSHRSVRVELTPEQLDALQLNWAHTSSGIKHYESVSHAFLEDSEQLLTDHPAPKPVDTEALAAELEDLACQDSVIIDDKLQPPTSEIRQAGFKAILDSALNQEKEDGE
jgi:hypothetical protein